MSRCSRSSFPAAAWGHASILETTPKVGQRLTASPRTITLRFDESVKVLANGIQVFDSNGKIVSGPPRVSPADGRIVEAPVPALPAAGTRCAGRRSRTTATSCRGVFTFGVRVAAPPISQAYGASGPTTAEHVVRWLYFLCLALLSRRHRLPAARAARPAARRRSSAASTAWRASASSAPSRSGILAFCLRAEDALQLDLTSFLYGDLSPFAHTTRFGQAFVVMELGFALVAALLYLAWLTRRSVLLWAAFLISIGLGSGLSLASHQGGRPRLAAVLRRLGAPRPRPPSGSAACSRSVSSSGPTASCAGPPSGASPGSPGRSSRSSSPRAST